MTPELDQKKQVKQEKQKPSRLAWTIWGVLLVLSLCGLGWAGYTLLGQARAAIAWRHVTEAIQARDYLKAEKDLAFVRSVWNESGEVVSIAARIARHLGKYDEANALLDQARDMGAEEHFIQVERALIRAQTGDLASVEPFLSMMANPKMPFELEIVSILTPLYFSTFDLSKAEGASKIWVEADPANPEAFQWRGLILDRIGAGPDAEQAFQKALELDPDRVDVHVYLASRNLRFNNPQAALEAIAKAEQIKPDHRDLPLLKGRALSEIGRDGEARTLLQEQIKTNPDPALFRELGAIELKSGLREPALEHLQIALKAFPMDHNLLFKVAQAQEQLGQKDAAAATRAKQKQVEVDLDRMKVVTRTIMERPNDPAPRIEAAKIMERNQVAIEACRWALSALKLNPGNAEALKVIEKNREAATKKNQYRSILEFIR